MKIHAIYAIENFINNKIYIGSAINVKSRFRQHRSDLNLNKHYNSLLQRAWNKYGERSFKFIILEEVKNQKDLVIREQYWINRFSSNERILGYNIREIAASNLGTVRSAETRAKISASKKGRRKGIPHSEERKKNIKAAWDRRKDELFKNTIVIAEFK